MNNSWRSKFDYDFFTGTLSGTSGVFPASVLRNEESKNPRLFKETIVTGTSGTVIIADVRGAHRASNLFKNYRLEIVQKFNPVV